MKYLTKPEVASFLRVSVRTLTTYMQQGLLPPPYRLGLKLLWEEGQLVDFIQRKPAPAPVPAGTPAKAKRGRPRKALN